MCGFLALWPEGKTARTVMWIFWWSWDPVAHSLAELLAAMIRELESLLGRKVDVVSDRGLRQRVRERVLQEALPL